MTAERRIREYLTTNPGRQYCDDCLSAALQIKPRQQVQQKTSALGREPSFRRAPGRCTRCHSDRIIVEAIVAHASPAAPRLRQPSANAIRPVAANTENLTSSEMKYCEVIRAKDHALRKFLGEHSLSDPVDAMQWLSYLVGIKHALGNINNDVGFSATLMVKRFLEQRFAIKDFDAAQKAQGASGIDVQAWTADGKSIAGELKTTKPYQPGFGAAQRVTILKDLERLAKSEADYRFMFVIDPGAFGALAHKTFMSCAPGIEVVNLSTGDNFICTSA